MTASLVPGVSYRQLDYWARMGYLNVDEPGSGRRRDWPPGELAVARQMGRLVQAGIPPELASGIARGMTEIAPGIHVCIDEPGQSTRLP